MHLAPLRALPRLFLLTLAAGSLLAASGCVNAPLIGDDIRVLRDSPHYLREAYVYADRDPRSEADEHFRTGDRRLFGAIGFGIYYPGCAPGVGEKLARRHGTILLPETGGGVETTAQEYYSDTVTKYAAAYNCEMANLLGVSEPRHR